MLLNILKILHLKLNDVNFGSVKYEVMTDVFK
jgi:hypothetical protein